MEVSKGGFDLNSLIIQVLNTMRDGDSANLYSYIIDALTDSAGKQNSQPANMDLSWLDDYIQKAVRESIDHQFQSRLVQDSEKAIDPSAIKPPQKSDQIENNESADNQREIAPSGMERIMIDIQPQIIDTNDNFIVRIKIAEGDDESKLNVHIYRDHLTVRVGSRLLEHIIAVPDNINAEHAVASVKNHILEIYIPKEQDECPKRININMD